MREAAELANAPSPDYFAAPLEDNLFEWHFTLRGPPESPYASGIYHGRITLPATYPMRPPSFRFLSPSGRFEVNREICLSISDHHEETWLPAWGVRTAVVALRGFMESEPQGQVGAIECGDDQRRAIADTSGLWKCETCGKSSADILKESEAAAKELGLDATADEETPAELKISFKVKKKEQEGGAGSGGQAADVPSTTPTEPPPQPQQAPPAASGYPPPVWQQDGVPAHVQDPLPPYFDQRYAPPPPPQQQQQQQQQQLGANDETFWLDRIIVALVVLLAAVLFKKVVGLPGVY